MPKVYYLASPYSHDSDVIQAMRYEQQGYIAAQLIKKGYHIITPIEMCHHLSLRYELPGGYDYWKKRDRELVRRTDGVIVCMMEGWSTSIGVTDEVDYAKRLGKPIKYLDPNTMKFVRRHDKRISGRNESSRVRSTKIRKRQLADKSKASKES